MTWQISHSCCLSQWFFHRRCVFDCVRSPLLFYIFSSSAGLVYMFNLIVGTGAVTRHSVKQGGYSASLWSSCFLSCLVKVTLVIESMSRQCSHQDEETTQAKIDEERDVDNVSESYRLLENNWRILIEYKWCLCLITISICFISLFEAIKSREEKCVTNRNIASKSFHWFKDEWYLWRLFSKNCLEYDDVVIFRSDVTRLR